MYTTIFMNMYDMNTEVRPTRSVESAILTGMVFHVSPREDRVNGRPASIGSRHASKKSKKSW